MKVKFIAVLAIASALIIAPVSAGIPFFGDKDETPTLAPMLEEVTPAVVNISVKGKREVRQRIPDIFQYFFGHIGLGPNTEYRNIFDFLCQFIFR